MTNQPERPRSVLTIVQIILVALLALSLTLAALFEDGGGTTRGLNPTPFPPLQPRNTAAATPSMSAEATPQAVPTSTASPILPQAVSASATPLREPIFHSGTGDSVFYPQKWIGPAVVRVGCDGTGPLAVWTQNDNGERQDMLVNTVGPYHGSSVIDLFGTQRILRFEVRTADTWTIEVLPLSTALHLAVPGAIQGGGDDVVVLLGPHAPDLLSVDAPDAAGNLSVTAYGMQSDEVIQAAGPYAGTVSLRTDVTVLAVKAAGPWRLEVTTR